MSQNVSAPYLSINVVGRDALAFGERITILVTSNVPEQALSNMKAFVNGKVVDIIDNKFSYNAYSKHTNIDVSAMLLSERELQQSKLLSHYVEPQHGCDVLHDDFMLYAICFSNLGSVQNAQFFLDGTPIGNQYGEFAVGATVPDDLSLKVFVNDQLLKYKIIKTDNKLISVPDDE